MKTLFVVVLALILTLSATSVSQVPQRISYQGLLTDSSGAPVVAGNYDLKFEIYNSSLGGAMRHSETFAGVAVKRGTFSVLLGTVTPFTFAFNESLYVAVTALAGPAISSPLTFSPRTTLTSAPYALQSLSLLGPNSNATGVGSLAGGSNNRARGNYSVVSGGGGANPADSNSAIGDYSTVAGGWLNSSRSYSATVGGGEGNNASGYIATIGGGATNLANNDMTTIGGGWLNVSSGLYTTVAGGWRDTASGELAAVGGGYANNASGAVATIAGGASNSSPGNWSAVGGGYQNNASGQGAAVVGGRQNSAGGPEATVGGGESNISSADHSTVSGGASNNATGALASVGGGGSNIASGSYSKVGGGISDTASGNGSTVGGGGSNNAGGDFSTVSGGGSNIASDYMSTVGGGQSNVASGNRSTVAGGSSNSASGPSSTVGGGWINNAGGYFATVPGGQYNTAAGDYSYAAGRRARANHNGSFVWGDATDDDFVSTAPNQFRIRASNGVSVVGSGTSQSGDLEVLNGAVQMQVASDASQAFGQIGTISDHALNFVTNGASKMYIGNNGAVGIGTTSPQNRLSISDGLNIDQSNYNAGTMYNALTFGSYSGEGIGSKRTVGGNQYGLDFYTGSVARLSIMNTGNIGIGTSNPNYPFEVDAVLQSISVRGVNAFASGGIAVSGVQEGIYGYGVDGYAAAGDGVRGTTENIMPGNVGVRGIAPLTGAAIYANGNLVVAGVKAFQIDHPLDPANKFLNHYCTEGPEPFNMYGGTATLDGSGEAWVTLPEYFQEINKNSRYQLTPIGAAMPNLHIAAEIKDNRFKVGGGVPGMKVSWQVMASRNDLYVQKAGAPVEIAKSADQRGKYLWPELYNLPASRGIIQVERPKEINTEQK